MPTANCFLIFSLVRPSFEKNPCGNFKKKDPAAARKNPKKAGLFVLTQSSDGGAALLNRKGFKPKEFSL